MDNNDKAWPEVVFLSVVAGGLFLLGGCGDFFAKKPTELESMAVLSELQEVRENPNLNNQLPDLYLGPPVKISIGEGMKLLYFTRHHPAADIGVLVNQQFGYKVVPNPATNQLVVYCPDEAASDTVLEYLDSVDIPPVQVNIDCIILERFGDITSDWEISVLAENFLGEGITLGSKRATFDSSGKLIKLAPALPGGQLRESARASFGLDFGYWMNQNVPGHQVRAMVDMLESRGYLKVLLNPTIESVNGRKATVTMQDYAPIEEITESKGGTSDVYSITKYVWVADSLSVTPNVYADGSIGISTEIKVGSRSKPEGITQKAIITERSINVAENRIKPGRSLIIGGMRKSERRSVVRGIPFLKDIPLLGVFFSSKDFEEKGTEIIFVLTPSISAGGKPYEKAAAEIRKKHEGIKYQPGLKGFLSDPLGATAYPGLIEKKTTDSEIERAVAEMEREQAQQRADAARGIAEKTQAEAQRIKAEADKAIADAQKARLEADNARKAALDAQKLTEEEAAKAAQALAEKEKAAAEAQAAGQVAAQAKKAAEEALARAIQEEQKAKAALEQIEKAVAQADAARARTAAAKKAQQEAEADAAKAAAEKARQEAEAQAAAEGQRSNPSEKK